MLLYSYLVKLLKAVILLKFQQLLLLMAADC